MIKIALLIIPIILLTSCMRVFNYLADDREFITSFPLDLTTTEEQVFEMDGIHTKKKRFSHGPFGLSLCVSDNISDIDKKNAYHNVRVVTSLSAKGFSENDERPMRSYSNNDCEFLDLDGWDLSGYGLPSDFDMNKKITISFQILKDEDGYLATLKNPRLILINGLIAK